MTLKRFSIFTAIIAGIIIVLTVVLSCIKVDSGLGLTPDKIIVYLEDSAGTTCYNNASDQRNQKHFDEIVKRYKKMTKLSLMDYMLHGNVVDTVPGQDYDGEYDSWSYSNRQDNYCLELIFKDKQSVVVKIDGDTKVVDFYGLIMVVKKSNLSHLVAMYFSTNEDYDTSKSYSNSPLLVQANQNSLLKYLEYMKTTQE